MKHFFYIVTLAIIIALVMPQANFNNANAKSKPENTTNKNRTTQNAELAKLKIQANKLANQIENLNKRIEASKASNNPDEVLALLQKKVSVIEKS